MNVSSVQLFLEVAEAGSLSKVAAAHGKAQPHVSRQIGELERDVAGAFSSARGAAWS